MRGIKKSLKGRLFTDTLVFSQRTMLPIGWNSHTQMPSPAIEQNIIRGKDAYGLWRDDEQEPGDHFL
jgi:hypothetical protein